MEQILRRIFARNFTHTDESSSNLMFSFLLSSMLRPSRRSSSYLRSFGRVRATTALVGRLVATGDVVPHRLIAQ
jgi:hypothetical protein